MSLYVRSLKIKRGYFKILSHIQNMSVIHLPKQEIIVSETVALISLNFNVEIVPCNYNAYDLSGLRPLFFC